MSGRTTRGRGVPLASDRDASLREFAGYTMKRAFHVIQSDVNRVLEPLGLRMVSFSALVVIADNPGLRQSELAETLMIERPNLVLVLDTLERMGLITRNVAPEDRRALAIEPTAEGRRLCEAAKEEVRRHDRRMTQGLDECERADLIAALRRIESATAREENDG